MASMPLLIVRKRCGRWRSRLTVVLVVGSKNSSNSNRLAELAQRMGRTAFLIDDTDIEEAWVKDAACVSVTAGSAGYSGAECCARLREFGGGEAVTLEGREENIVFEVPKSCVWMFVKSNKISQFRNLPDDATLMNLGISFDIQCATGKIRRSRHRC